MVLIDRMWLLATLNMLLNGDGNTIETQADGFSINTKFDMKEN